MSIFDRIFGSARKSTRLFNTANDAWKAQQSAALRLDYTDQIRNALEVVRNCQLSIEAAPTHGDPYVLLTNALMVCASAEDLNPDSELALQAAVQVVYDYWSDEGRKRPLRIKNAPAANQIADIVAARGVRRPDIDTSVIDFDPVRPESFHEISRLATDTDNGGRASNSGPHRTVTSDSASHFRRVVQEFYAEVLGNIASERGNYFNEEQKPAYVELIDSSGITVEHEREHFGGPASFSVQHHGSVVATGHQANQHQPWILDTLEPGEWEASIPTAAILSYRCFQADFVGDVYHAAMGAIQPGDAFEYVLIHDVAGLESHINTIADLDAPNNAGQGLLGFAITTRAFECVEPLLDAGVDVNSTNDEGWSSLSAAARSGNLDIAKLLIERGAALDSTTSGPGSGLQPLADAIIVGDLEMAELLLSRGAELEPRDPNASPIPHIACRWSGVDYASLRWVLSKDIDLDMRDNEGEPALFHCLRDRLGELRLLIEAGASLEATDRRGETALQRCLIGTSYLNELKLLLESGASVESIAERDRNYYEEFRPEIHAILAPYY